MFGLTRDFVQQDGIRMVLGGREGMPISRLNTVQSRMLSSLSIPHHLRLFLKEVDLSVTLEYSVSGKKLLSHLLKRARLSLAELYGLLLQIAQGMEDGRLHMLRPEQYALHEDYIFIEGPLQTGKVYLAYVPLQMIEPAQSLGESLKGLIMALMPSVTELNGDGVQRLLHYCGEEECTASGWKELLSELLTEDDGERHSIVDAETAAAASSSTEAVKLPVAEWRGGSSFFQDKQDNIKLGGEKKRRWKDEDDAEPDLALDTDRPSNGRNSSKKTYILLGCILLDALLWKYVYLDHPGSLLLMLCGFATVVLAAISGLAWMGKIGWGESEEEEFLEEDADDPEFRLPVGFGSAPLFERQNKFDESHKFQPPPVERSKRVSAGILEFGPGEKESKWAEEYPKTSDSGSATVLLSREKVPASVEAKLHEGGLPYLERTEEGSDRREKIELNRTSFIIGRSPEVAQYVESSEGASRVHVEVFRSGGGYVLKDLDSRNGTRFKGEAMIPYKEYPLDNGDDFTIVKGNYTFHQR
ncbi:Forkhead associated (FHA) domain, binds pSer, pThr, pTyr [Paenibacillus sophorae]|uniref:FHA domain-containing protein n=1 Tax=Paenibacillus sophorae TaxID=1333845 RepID=A0A1H8L5K5_9BACL|nr:DUF6382 domain-containing protein [Paenibacillus sophorae]QWU17421.1 FHA domain-containing protein [Paenibacillus sophorae]SEO00395.1 Forkhead associated (FHA) domain, binds pSer, pThr, pTyr [Paenibacillus sophorae]